MATPDPPRPNGESSPKPTPQKSFIRLDPSQSDEEREAVIYDWLVKILGEPVDDG